MDFLDFEVQDFDLVIMNPPFSKVGIKMIEKATTLSDIVAFIGPSNPLGYGFWRKQKEHFAYTKYLKPEDMGINLDSCMGIWTRDTRDTQDSCILDTGTTGTTGTTKIEFNPDKYPLVVPHIQNNCTLDEYDIAFDQINGLKFMDSRSQELGTYGLQRDTDLFYGPLKEQKSSVSIYVCDKITGLYIMNNINLLLKEQKIIILDKGRSYYTKCFAGLSKVRVPEVPVVPQHQRSKNDPQD